MSFSQPTPHRAGNPVELNNTLALREAYNDQGRYVETLELMLREIIATENISPNLSERCIKILDDGPKKFAG